MRNIAAYALVAALAAAAGCFDEPEPAYKTVPAEARAYLQGRGFADFASAASGNITGERLVVDGGCTCQHMPEDVDR